MTIEEFDKQPWSAGLTVIYKGRKMNVGSVCFEEKLIGIYKDGENECPDTNRIIYDWVRCENVNNISDKL
jgi:hypothetical protein